MSLGEKIDVPSETNNIPTAAMTRMNMATD